MLGVACVDDDFGSIIFGTGLANLKQWLAPAQAAMSGTVYHIYYTTLCCTVFMANFVVIIDFFCFSVILQLEKAQIGELSFVFIINPVIYKGLIIPDLKRATITMQMD